MGTQRVKIYGAEPEEEKKPEKEVKEKEVKKAEPEKPKVVKEEKFTKPAVVKRRGKKWQKAISEVDKNKTYSLDEAIELVKKTSYSSFDGSVELHIRLKPKKNQTVRGSLELPHGTGKKRKVEVFSDDLLEKIQKGKIDFDILLARPADMPKLAKVAKILGPRGLMPNPKSGTIVENPKEAMEKFKGGLIEYKADTGNIVHQNIGKVSWEKKKLEENALALISELKRYNPISITISATMGPGIRVEVTT